MRLLLSSGSSSSDILRSIHPSADAVDRVQREEMKRGTITVTDGSVSRLQAEGQGPALLGSAILHTTLNIIEVAGWIPDGDLPTYTTERTYAIAIIKNEG